MLAKYLSIIQNYVLSVFFAKKVNYLQSNRASPTNSCNIIGWDPLMVIPLLVNQDLTPMLKAFYPQASQCFMLHPISFTHYVYDSTSYFLI